MKFWSKTVPLNVSVIQESPRVGVRWSIISLNGLSYEDAGEYRCQARNMAGISEAPIKLKVMGVSRLTRFPKKKPKKTPVKSSPKYRKPNQTSAGTNTLTEKDSPFITSIFTSLKSRVQKAWRPQLNTNVKTLMIPNKDSLRTDGQNIWLWFTKCD